MSTDRFYRAFEDLFRGGREVILGRLREGYADFLAPLVETSEGRRVLDLGCGRGEWLELTGDLGLDAHGIDLDEGMLEDCAAQGLSVERGEALEHLRRLPDGSTAVVSAFHLVEHLPFDLLKELVQEALRVLEPGGLLVMETPNPENLKVASLDFHLDPTHLSPIPPEMLAFMPRHYGFARVATVRLQEDPALRQAPVVTLLDVLQGASPDYGVIAQKRADDAVLQRFDAAFARGRGLNLDMLAVRFQEQVATRSELEALRADVKALQKAQGVAEARVRELEASSSWRVTKPLRAAGTVTSRVAAKARAARG